MFLTKIRNAHNKMACLPELTSKQRSQAVACPECGHEILVWNVEDIDD